MTTSGVPRERGLGGSNPPRKFRSFAKPEPNSQFRGIYIRNNLIRIWVSFICKLSVEPLTRGLPPPDPRSVCPLSLTEFVEPPWRNPPPEKIPRYATDDHLRSCYEESMHTRTTVIMLDLKWNFLTSYQSGIWYSHSSVNKRSSLYWTFCHADW
jgi:hypothetical protein